jgi:hypothetical protein
MKKIALLIASLIFLLSCEKDDTFPSIENITSGKKWTLQIGSSPTEVYSQLQDLGVNKNFNDVGMSRLPFSHPNEIRSDLSLYWAITLETTSGRTERALIQFDQDKVSSIEKGGGLLDPIPKWPEDESDETAIHVNDPIEEIYEKLEAIYQNPIYENYQIVLSSKRLENFFDPDMSNYNEWYFVFSVDVSPGRAGRSLVRLFFKNDKLSKIRHEYSEFDIVN